jgi:hypothetical protein
MEEKLVCYCFGYSEEDMIREVRGEKALHPFQMSAASWTGQM